MGNFKIAGEISPLLTTAKEAYLGNLSDEWETVEKEAMALVEYMKNKLRNYLEQSSKVSGANQRSR